MKGWHFALNTFIFLLVNLVSFSISYAGGWSLPTGRALTPTELDSWHSYTGHVGIDIMQSADSSVFAVSDGVIVDYDDSLSRYGSWAGADGGAILVKHVTSSGMIFYALYGHCYIKSGLNIGYPVYRGQPIGKIHAYYGLSGAREDHLHFGIHPNVVDSTNKFRGVGDAGNDYGWVNPKTFMESYSPMSICNPSQNCNIFKEGDIGWWPKFTSCEDALRWYRIYEESGILFAKESTKSVCYENNSVCQP